MWTIFIILIVATFIIKTVISNDKDKQEMSETPLEEKFKGIIYVLNSQVFNNNAEVTKINNQMLNLYSTGENQIIQFMYAHGGLTIEWKYKYFQKEVVHTKRFVNVRNISVFEQQNMAESLIKEMNIVVKNHKKKSGKPF